MNFTTKLSDKTEKWWGRREGRRRKSGERRGRERGENGTKIQRRNRKYLSFQVFIRHGYLYIYIFFPLNIHLVTSSL